MIALNRYARTQNETASKERLLVLLLEKALRDLRFGAESLEKGRPGESVHPLTRASDILQALRATLDPQIAPALGANLRELYGFCSARLTLAAINQQPKLAREAERALEPIVAAFTKAVAELGGKGGTGAR